MNRRFSFLAVFSATCLLAACQTPYNELSKQHLTQPSKVLPNDIPKIVTQSKIAQLPPAPPPQTFTVVVTQADVRGLLFSIANDAKIDVSIHIPEHKDELGNRIPIPVTLNAIRQPLPQILDRIAEQTGLRWSIKNKTIIVELDTPYLKTYNIDYVNVARSAKSSIGATSSVGVTEGGSGGDKTSNSSSSSIENESKHEFWKNLISALDTMLNQFDLGAGAEAIGKAAGKAVTGTGETIDTAKDGASATTKNKNDQQIAQRVAGNEAATQTESSDVQNLAKLSAARTAAQTQADKSRIIAHPETGTISILATEQQHRQIQTFLNQITQNAHRQVLIEVTIAEVELNHNFSAGIDWSGSFKGGQYKYSQSFSTLVTPSEQVSSQTPLPIFNYVSSAGNILSAVKLMEDFGKTKVLSSPKLMALNNQAAMLKATQDVPYFTLEIERTEATNNTPARDKYTSTLKTVSEGIVMNIQPQIAPNGEITLNVRPTISKIIGYVRNPAVDLVLRDPSIPNGVPVVQVRELESTLRLSSGQIAILGGLIQDKVTDLQVGLPGFNRLPIFGNAFKYRSDSSKKTELVVFLKPTLVNDPNIATDLNTTRELLPNDTFFKATDYDRVSRGYPSRGEK